jgi:hypothetical protein
MESLTSEIITLLKYLLPGFLSSWIFYGFTSFQKPNQFERVIQALIFTLIIQVVVLAIEASCYGIGRLFSFGSWTEKSVLISSVIVAAAIGFIFSFFANTDKFHCLIRKVGISKETSYPSEWFGEFSNRITYVVLHLEGERRIYGWPKEWPSSHESGHFSLNQASWLTESGEIPLENVQAIIIPAKAVLFVEFMEKTWEQNE